MVNYPPLPRSGLLAPCLLRVGLPVSASELASGVDTAVPDSAGDFPSRAVRSVPLLPVGHSATTDGARFLSSFERASLSRDDERRVASFEPRLNTAGGVVSIVLHRSTAGVVKPRGKAKENDDGVNESLCDSFAHQNRGAILRTLTRRFASRSHTRTLRVLGTGVNRVRSGTFLPIQPVCTPNRGGTTAPMPGQSDNLGIPSLARGRYPCCRQSADTDANQSGTLESPTG